MIYTDFLALRAVRRISTSAYAKRYRSELQEAIDAIEQCPVRRDPGCYCCAQ